MGTSAGSGRFVSGRGGQFKSLTGKRDTPARLNDLLNPTREKIGDAVQAAILGGLGVLLAPTSDGGAISVTVYDGDERLRSYASTGDEWEEVLRALTDAGDAAATRHLPKAEPRRTGR